MKALPFVSLITIWATSVCAQDVSHTVELTDPHANIAVLGITVEQAIDSEVIDTQGDPIGTVTRVLGDDMDSPTALVLSVNGREVTFKLHSMELINNQIVANRSGEALEFEAPFE